MRVNGLGCWRELGVIEKRVNDSADVCVLLVDAAENNCAYSISPSSSQ